MRKGAWIDGPKVTSPPGPRPSRSGRRLARSGVPSDEPGSRSDGDCRHGRDDRLGRADLDTPATARLDTIVAAVGIDDVNIARLGDGPVGALGLAVPATDAVVRDRAGHVRAPDGWRGGPEPGPRLDGGGSGAACRIALAGGTAGRGLDLMPLFVPGSRVAGGGLGAEVHPGRLHRHVKAVLVADVDADAAGDAAELLDGEGAILPRDRERDRGAASRTQAAEDARVQVELDGPARAREVRADLAGVATRGGARHQVAQRSPDHRQVEGVGHLSAPCS